MNGNPSVNTSTGAAGNAPFQTLTGLDQLDQVRDVIDQHNKKHTTQAWVQRAARFDRKSDANGFRGTIPIIAQSAISKELTPRMAELLSRLVAVQRILLCMDHESAIIPVDFDLPTLKKSFDFSAEFSVEAVKARQAMLIAEIHSTQPHRSVEVFTPIAEFAPTPEPPVILVQKDDLWVPLDVRQFNRTLKRVHPDWKRKLPRRPEEGVPLNHQGLRHPDLILTSDVDGRGNDIKTLTLRGFDITLPWTAPRIGFDWSQHKLIQVDITRFQTDPAPLPGWRLYKPSLRVPKGTRGNGAVQYDEVSGARESYGEGWFPFTKVPSNMSRKIAEHFADYPGIFGTSGRFTRELYDLFLLQASRDYQRGGQFVELKPIEFAAGLTKLRRLLAKEKDVQDGFVEAMNSFVDDVSSLLRTQLSSHWLRRFVLDRRGIDKMGKAVRSDLMESFRSEDPESFWSIWPILALHGHPEIPGQPDEVNQWLQMAAGHWPVLHTPPRVELWAYAHEEYEMLAGTFIPEVKAEVLSPVAATESRVVGVKPKAAPKPPVADLLTSQDKLPSGASLTALAKQLGLPESVVLESLREAQRRARAEEAAKAKQDAPMTEADLKALEACALLGEHWHVPQPVTAEGIQQVLMAADQYAEKLRTSDKSPDKLEDVESGIVLLENALALLVGAPLEEEVLEEAQPEQAATPLSEADLLVLRSCEAFGENWEAILPATVQTIDRLKKAVQRTMDRAAQGASGQKTAMLERFDHGMQLLDEAYALVGGVVETPVETSVVAAIAPVEPVYAVSPSEHSVAMATETEEAAEEAVEPEVVVEEEAAEEAVEPEVVVEEEAAEEAVEPEVEEETPVTQLPESVQVQPDTHEAAIAGATEMEDESWRNDPNLVRPEPGTLAARKAQAALDIEFVCKVHAGVATAIVDAGILGVQALTQFSASDIAEAAGLTIGEATRIQQEAELALVHGVYED